MLGSKLATAIVVLSLILTLVADNEVDAAPEPCKELIDMLIKPQKLKKPKEDKEDISEETEKPKKEKRKKLQKLEKMLESLSHWEEHHKKVKVDESKGVFQQLVESYVNFLSNLMQL